MIAYFIAVDTRDNATAHLPNNFQVDNVQLQVFFFSFFYLLLDNRIITFLNNGLFRLISVFSIYVCLCLYFNFILKNYLLFFSCCPGMMLIV